MANLLKYNLYIKLTRYHGSVDHLRVTKLLKSHQMPFFCVSPELTSLCMHCIQ